MPTSAVHLNTLLDDDETLFELNWSYGFAGSRDSGAGTWLFAATCDNPTAAIYELRDQWVTRTRAELTAGVEHDFGQYPNWGDFINAVTDSELAAAGLRRITWTARASLDVDHDTTLV